MARRCTSFSCSLRRPGLFQVCVPEGVFTPETGLDSGDAEPPLLVFSQVLSPREALGSCPRLPLGFSEAAPGARSRESCPGHTLSASSPTPLPRPRLPRLSRKAQWGLPRRQCLARSYCGSQNRLQGSLPQHGRSWVPATPLSLDQRILPSTSDQMLGKVSWLMQNICILPKFASHDKIKDGRGNYPKRHE